MPLTKRSLLLGFQTVVLLYLAGDLFVFTGPLRQWMRRGLPDSPQSIAKAKAEGVVARVANRSILSSQVDRTAKERLWLRGMTMESLAPAEQQAERKVALDELIDHELLRFATQDQAAALPVANEEVDDALKRLAARFESPDEMRAHLAAEGIDSEKELRLRLGARLQQQRFIESRIAPGVTVSDQEARTWFDAHAAELARPERIEAQHVFVSTLQRDSAEARALLEKALGEWTAKQKDFAAIAAELSDDPRSKGDGGKLGWMTLDRLPADFAAPVFSLPLNRPSLVRTKLGWHLVEVTGRKPAEPRNFDEAKVEVIAALAAVKRRDAMRDLRKALREAGRGSIEVLDDLFTE
ncbi:peptidylprolyl isomerase [Luteolibacter arcticus]|uniref:Peptidylprolyl isomerase n=1 Tax=Luteolibacter arcticus TaxID=1581411 RepID=A0ABT3GCU9_9BACT|nr:peptidylprolyl isomerase [Luteolibacter arcticus]MCW1921078.1 peptidylprolyl isomerase [Luteolibacter arcticus]